MSHALKKQIRQEVKEHKKKLSASQAEAETALIFERIEDTDEFRQAKSILIYWALPDEVQTRGFIRSWLGRKHIILPVVEGTMLKLKELHQLEQMTEGQRYKIAEPDHADYFDAWQVDLAIVPGVAFDRQGQRLGRGRAYYDRLLKDMHCPKIGICYSFQRYENLPAETHDIPMDMVISGHADK